MSRVTQWLLALVLAATCMAAARPAQAAVEYIHTDALGTPVAITDADGNVLQTSEYEPYGKLLNRPVTDGPGYTGHEEDAATGLTYMQQRYYDPSVGRFLSVDPVTAYEKPMTNFNRYVYAFNNPYKFTDPDGRDGANFYTDPQYRMGTPTDPEALKTVAGVLPVVGDLVAIGDAIHDPSPINIAAAVIGVIPEVGPLAGDALKEARAAEKIGADVGKLPKPPTGPGSVAKAERDPKRFFSEPGREAKRAEQGHQCANGCGTKIDASNSAGHHIERHADGGRTVPENHAEVCIPCHKELHSGN